jgi:hypothetical protein
MLQLKYTDIAIIGLILNLARMQYMNSYFNSKIGIYFLITALKSGKHSLMNEIYVFYHTFLLHHGYKSCIIPLF